MRLHMIFFCLLMCIALPAVEWQPLQADLTRPDGSVDRFYVKYEDREKLICTQDPAIGWAELPQSSVASIDYHPGLIEILDYAQAIGALKRGDTERAISGFEKCTTQPRQALQITARESLADLHAQAGRYDEAIEQLQMILKEHSDWPRLAGIVAEIGDVQLQAGKPDAAMSTFEKLGALAARFGERATILGLKGQARVLARKDQPGQAADLLQKAFDQIDASAKPETKATIAVDLAAQQVAAERGAAAIATLRGVQFLPVAPALQARLHTDLASVLKDQGELVAGFDQAIMAAVVAGIDDETKRSALNVAFRISKQIDASSDFSDEEKLAFRQALSKP